MYRNLSWIVFFGRYAHPELNVMECSSTPLQITPTILSRIASVKVYSIYWIQFGHEKKSHWSHWVRTPNYSLNWNYAHLKKIAVYPVNQLAKQIFLLEATLWNNWLAHMPHSAEVRNSIRDPAPLCGVCKAIVTLSKCLCARHWTLSCCWCCRLMYQNY